MVDGAQGDIARHEAGWLGFVRFITLSIIAISITLLAMAYFLL